MRPIECVSSGFKGKIFITYSAIQVAYVAIFEGNFEISLLCTSVCGMVLLSENVQTAIPTEAKLLLVLSTAAIYWPSERLPSKKQNPFCKKLLCVFLDFM